MATMAESQTLQSVADAIVNMSRSTSAVTPLAMATVTGTPSASSFGVVGGMILTLLRVIPSTLLWTITFLSITLPSWLFTMFSTSLTITLNFTTLALMLLVFVSTISWVVRYRMNTSSRALPQLERRDRPEVELFPEAQEESSKPGLSNYLDEFLSAIKVFGYLERPVFHELTRTMQTRKLIAGETIDLEEEKGFCLVVDGTVQIFVKSRHSNQEDDVSAETSLDSGDGPDNRRQSYQLLTTVKNGNPMSSLFTILSLFTESIKLRHHGEQNSMIASEGVQPRIPPGIVTPDTDSGSPLQLPSSQTRPPVRDRRSSSLASTTTGSRLQRVPHLSLETDSEGRPHQSAHGLRSEPKSSNSVHPDIVARAVTDTTIAIIPATAFKRLTRLYPRATAHIVQVILTRLQRVTLATGQAYLGLSKEVLRTEKLMNKYTTFELPDVLRDASITRLKEKFSKERERVPSEDSTKGIALHNPGIARRRRSSSSLRREAAAQARLAAAQTSPSPDAGRSGVSAGDLLTNGGSRAGRVNFSQPLKTPAPALRDARKSQGYFSLSTAGNGGPVQLQHQESMLDEDSIFREHVLDCMCKAIGLSGTTNALLNTDSAQASPRLTGQKPTFHNNAFGYIDPYESSIDLDSESVTSASPSSHSVSGYHSIHEELINEVEIVFFPKDSELVNQGERNPGLYYVIDGFLDVGVPCDDEQSEPSVVEVPTQSNGTIHDLFSGPPLRKTRTGSSRAESVGRAGESGKKKRDRKNLFVAKPGSLAGYLGTVSSHRSFVDVTAKTDCIVGFIPRLAVERIADKYPIVLLTLAKRLTTILPKVLLDLDFALEWVQVNAGQIIFKQREESDAIYIVLNGRLRAVREGKDGAMSVTGEFGQGDSVGELEVLTESPRPTSLHAIRDTELAKVPQSLFKSLALEHPTITIKMSKVLAQRMRSLLSDPLYERGQERTVTSTTRSGVSPTVNLRTAAILPITSGVPVVEFGNRLLHALSQIGTSVVSLNQAAILNHLGRHAFNRMGKLKLSQYLADLEEKYGLVLYVADTNVQSPWTQTCISQADCILLVGIAEGSPAIGEYERYLLTTKTTARKELVLLHAERGTVRSGLTSAWLRPRMWINGAHHHVQMSVRTTPEPVHPQFRRIGSAIKQRVQVLQAEIQKYTSRRVRQTPLYSAETPFKGDFHRLARRLCGKSVGLVLGGGGARGIAHVGVIRAMEEAGIPIDIIGGTSIGAFIGALYAWNADVVPMYGRAKKFAGRMGSIWRFLLDLTYPTSSYTTGHEFNRGLIKTFGDAQIEDFWLEYYCNTTNISKSRPEIHTSGYIWRYVRASMTLAGLLPPLTDNGDMLVDGGYIDNLTVAHMKSLGADVVFAVDVGSLDDHTPQEWGDSLSGFWVLFNRYNPFSSAPNPLTLSEIQARLAYVSSVDALEKAKATPGCFYMRPPIDPYGTLDFGKFEEIYKVGFEFAKQYLGQLREQGTLPITQESEEERQNLRRTMAPRRASI